MSSEGDHRGESRARWPDAGEKPPLTSVSTRQQHIATVARKYAGSPLTTLSHHMDMLWLREAYGRVRRDSAPGVDGQTVADHGENLEANLQSLLPPILLLTIGALFWMFRSWRLTLLVMGAVVVSFVWTMGLYVLMGFTYNVLASMMPPLVMTLSLRLMLASSCSCCFFCRRMGRIRKKNPNSMMTIIIGNMPNPPPPGCWGGGSSANKSNHDHMRSYPGANAWQCCQKVHRTDRAPKGKPRPRSATTGQQEAQISPR